MHSTAIQVCQSSGIINMDMDCMMCFVRLLPEEQKEIGNHLALRGGNLFRMRCRVWESTKEIPALGELIYRLSS